MWWLISREPDRKMATAMTNSGSRKRTRNGHSKSKDEDVVDNVEDEGPVTKKVQKVKY